MRLVPKPALSEVEGSLLLCPPPTVHGPLSTARRPSPTVHRTVHGPFRRLPAPLFPRSLGPLFLRSLVPSVSWSLVPLVPANTSDFIHFEIEKTTVTPLSSTKTLKKPPRFFAIFVDFCRQNGPLPTPNGPSAITPGQGKPGISGQRTASPTLATKNKSVARVGHLLSFGSAELRSSGDRRRGRRHDIRVGRAHCARHDRPGLRGLAHRALRCRGSD